MTQRPTRSTFVGDECLVPELAMAGWSVFTRAQVQGLGPHTHPGAYEFCYLDSGTVDWWVGDSVYEVRRGDLFVTQPDEEHGGLDAAMHPCAVFWIQVRMSEDITLPGMDAKDTERLLRDLAGIRHRNFPGSPEVRDLFARVMAEHQDPGPYSASLVRSLVLQIVVSVVRDYARHAQRMEGQDTGLSARIRAAQTWMDERLSETFSVADAAAVAGMSPSHFYDRFLREVGLPPAEYRTRRRIRRAKQMLREDRLSVTEIAYQLGYSTSQYFATAFKNLTGVTPRDYRRRVQAGER